MRRVVVTGADGLLGWHARARMHAANCAAIYGGGEALYEIIACDREKFADKATLAELLSSADAVLHFAGINRGSDNDVAHINPAIAEALVAAARVAKRSDLHVLYANSTHSRSSSIYGLSKRLAGEVLGKQFHRFTEFVLPHILGEHARPHYNNVTATFIDDVISGKESAINSEGQVELLHAGVAAEMFLDAISNLKFGMIAPAGELMGVAELADKIRTYHEAYRVDKVPALSRQIDVDIFNCYRAATFPNNWPRVLETKQDNRGMLFEAVKSEGSGQVFLSSTGCGVTRGNHFHLRKVERFLVIKGEAIIRLRRVLHSEVLEYVVSGSNPAYIDMPTLFTHSIENIGQEELVTLFWTNELFDPADPDTYSDMVMK